MTVPSAEDGQITLEVGPGDGKGVGLELNTWKSYSFNSHFLTPTDGWSFTLGDETISDELRAAIAPRQRVTFKIGGHVQGTGYIDKVMSASSRGSGLELTIEGRDLLSPVIDSCIDPRIEFKASMTLADVLRTVFAPFGWTDKTKFRLDAASNRNIMTGLSGGQKLVLASSASSQTGLVPDAFSKAEASTNEAKHARGGVRIRSTHRSAFRALDLGVCRRWLAHRQQAHVRRRTHLFGRS